MENIPNRYKYLTIRILQFLIHSERPLRVDEVVDMIAVDTKGKPRFDPNNRLPVPHEISRSCSSLVVSVTRETRNEGEITEIQLAHFSVKEYLVSDRLERNMTQHFEETTARASIAMVSLTYLLELNHNLSVQQITESFPLARYCARYWMDHAAVAETRNEMLQSFIKEFFLSENAYFSCCRLYNPDRPWDSEPTGHRESISALYYASLGGLMWSVRMLVENGADINAQGGFYGNALQAASAKGHENIVQILIDKGAYVNAQGGFYGNALQAASLGGHKNIVQILIDNGADVNAQGGIYGNALQAASQRGHENIVQILVNKGANVSTQWRRIWQRY